jgi:hypothetical protein
MLPTAQTAAYLAREHALQRSWAYTLPTRKLSSTLAYTGSTTMADCVMDICEDDLELSCM